MIVAEFEANRPGDRSSCAAATTRHGPATGSRRRTHLAGFSILIALSAVASCAKARLHDPGAVANEGVLGTLAVISSNESADGKPVACGFQFSATGQAPDAGHGAPAKVVGSYHLRLYAAGIVGYSLKLGIYDGLAWAQPSPPDDARVRAPRAASASSVARLLAETPGFALFFGLLDEPPESVSAAIVDEGMLVIGFRRTPDRQSVVLVVNLRVAATRIVDGRIVRTMSTKAVDDFAACTRALPKVPHR